MVSVEVRNLTRTFGAHKALDNFSMRFEDGGFHAILGPSGSGKTTLLRMIAGFDFPDSGEIEIGGESVNQVPPEMRQIGMVFQNYALFPNMSVAENVAFGLDVRGVRHDEMRRRVQAALDLVQLGEHGSRRPHQLSAGQRQRVALARAFVFNPRVLLLDEPLGALDKALRVDMQAELKHIQREIGITTVFVTHDQEEALTMADRIGIMRDGRLIEEGRPEEIYNRPRTLFAATFLGDANILSGTWSGEAMILGDGTLVRIADRERPRPGDKVTCAIRPERIQILAEGVMPADNTIAGRITRRMFTGPHSTVFVECPGGSMRIVVPNGRMLALKDGQAITITWSQEATIPVRDETA